MHRSTIALVTACLALPACERCADHSSTFDVIVEVVDVVGEPIPDADVRVNDTNCDAEGDGTYICSALGEGDDDDFVLIVSASSNYEPYSGALDVSRPGDDLCPYEMEPLFVDVELASIR